MLSIVGNFLTGSGLKMLGYVVTKIFELKRQKDMATINADLERIKVLQGGEDKSDTWSKVTRRMLALMLVGTWCFVVIWHVVFKPNLEYSVLINKDVSWIWSFFFNTTDKVAMKISAGSLLWDFKNFIEIIAGFYFTKVGK